MEQIKSQLQKLNDNRSQIIKTGLSIVTAFTLYKAAQKYGFTEENEIEKEVEETVNIQNRNTQKFQSAENINKKTKKNNKRKEIEIINTNETVCNNTDINKECLDVSEINNNDFFLTGLRSIIIDNKQEVETQEKQIDLQEETQTETQEIYIEDSDESIEDEDNVEIENQRYLEDFNSLQNNGNITPVKAITFFVKKNITVKQLKNTYKNCNQELNKNISFDTFCKISQMIES
jgi:hypothetical protein